jgi:hypothetical protein
MAFVSVLKSTLKNGNPGRPNPKNPYIILFKEADLSAKPVKGIDGVTVTAPIVLKAGKSAIKIYGTPSTISVHDASSGDPDKKGFTHNLEFEHPGSSVEYSQFVNENVNENLLAIVVYPDLATNKLLGWPGNPLQLNHEQKDDKDSDTNTVKLASLFAGDKIIHYSGALPAIEGETSGA